MIRYETQLREVVFSNSISNIEQSVTVVYKLDDIKYGMVGGEKKSIDGIINWKMALYPLTYVHTFHADAQVDIWGYHHITNIEAEYTI